MAAPRNYDERKAHALGLLKAPMADAWVATASADGVAHLVPLSIGWTGDRVLLVTESDSVTGRNLARGGSVRLGLGGTRDVVMVLAEVVDVRAVADAVPSMLESFVQQSGWEVGAGSDADRYGVYVLRPVSIQAWREANEITGRTLMKAGQWVGDTQP